MADEKVITMNPEEVKQLTEKLGKDAGEKINQLFEQATKGSEQSLSEVKKMVEEIKTIEGKGIVEYVKAIQEQYNAQEKLIKELKESPAKGESFHDVLASTVKKEHARMLQNVKEKRTFETELKTVGDMSITTNYGAGVIQPLYLPGVTPVAKRRTTLYDLVNKVPWATQTVTYVENSGGEGTIDAVAESGKFNHKDYDFVARTLNLSKVAAYSKITAEMIENSDNVVSFIQNELVRDTLLALENDILKGNGSAPTMKGLQHADHYTAAAIPGNYTLPSGIVPTEVDVLRAIITQMQNAYFTPSVILMHPTDTMKLDLARDKNGQFLIPPFASRDNTIVKGVPIVEHANLTEGTFHVIDGTRVNLYIQRGLNLKLWDQNEADAIYDLMTMTSSVKAGVLIKNNEKAANIFGTFSTLITALTAGS
jgi:HK97 family phage major capsid protein